MRDGLKDLCGKKSTFTGVFCKIGHRNSFFVRGSKKKYLKKLNTVLIRDLKDEEGNIVADHIWLDLTPPWVRVHPNFGDIVEFKGSVQNYVKGMCSSNRYYSRNIYELDYTIAGITDIKVLGHLPEDIKEEVLRRYDEQENEGSNC